MKTGRTLKKLLSKAKPMKFLTLIPIIPNYVYIILLKQQQKDFVLSLRGCEFIQQPQDSCLDL